VIDALGKALTNRSVTLTSLRRHSEAATVLDELISLRRGGLGNCEEEERLKQQVYLANALLRRGIVLSRLGRLPDAISSLDEAAAIIRELLTFFEPCPNMKPDEDPAREPEDSKRLVARELARAQMHRGVVLRKLGRPEEAKVAFDEAFTLCPDLRQEDLRQALQEHEPEE
jgi:tetratricopeptide (TPR) repeat protein